MAACFLCRRRVLFQPAVRAQRCFARSVRDDCSTRHVPATSALDDARPASTNSNRLVRAGRGATEEESRHRVSEGVWADTRSITMTATHGANVSRGPEFHRHNVVLTHGVVDEPASTVRDFGTCERAAYAGRVDATADTIRRRRARLASDALDKRPPIAILRHLSPERAISGVLSSFPERR